MSTESYLHKREARLWVLGADDPEMQAIEQLLRDAGECFHYAAVRDPSGPHRRLHDAGTGGSQWNYRRVTPGEAYGGKEPRDLVYGHCPEDLRGGCPLHIIAVECDAKGWTWPEFWGHGGFEIGYTVVDHHRPGDPGFGQPPENFWAASSIGQVFKLLGLERSQEETHRQAEVGWAAPNPPRDLLLVAAADHCLGAAYAGRCLGAQPEDLLDWRVSNVLTQPAPGRGARTVEEVLANIEAAVKLLDADTTADFRPSVPPDPSMEPDTTGRVKDLRGRGLIPDLPEAACWLGVGYISDAPSREGERPKVVIGGCGAGTVPGTEPIEWFLADGYKQLGLVDPYGDPVRGFAGAYFPEQGGQS